jgi:hypothetical protein
MVQGLPRKLELLIHQRQFLFCKEKLEEEIRPDPSGGGRLVLQVADALLIGFGPCHKGVPNNRLDLRHDISPLLLVILLQHDATWPRRARSPHGDSLLEEGEHARPVSRRFHAKISRHLRVNFDVHVVGIVLSPQRHIHEKPLLLLLCARLHPRLNLCFHGALVSI